MSKAPLRSLLLNYLRPVIFKTSNMIYGSNKQPSYEITSYYSNKITNNWIQQQALWSIQPNTRSRREARAPGRAPLGKQARRFRKAKKAPRREGMSGPLIGPDRTMMRDAMRQEGSTHPGRREPHRAAPMSRRGSRRRGTGPCEPS